MNYEELLEKENELIGDYEKSGFEIQKEFKNSVARFVTLRKGKEIININRLPINRHNENQIELQITSLKKGGFMLTEVCSYSAQNTLLD